MPYQELRRGRVAIPNQAYHITICTHRRHPVFSELAIARRLIQLMHQQNTADHLATLAYMLMPDHLHWLVHLHTSALGKEIGKFKGRSSRIIGQEFNLSSPLWQRQFYDHAIRAEEDLRAIARYMVGNPLRARLVEKIGDYPHWDAIWL